MQDNDLNLLINAAQQAGEIAKSMHGTKMNKWEKAEGQGPVSAADIAVNSMLEDQLRNARPQYGWLSEESEDCIDRLQCKSVFIIDPIDGTSSYIKGLDTWALSLAVSTKGKITAAVIYLPMHNLLYSACHKTKSKLNGVPIHASNRKKINGAFALTNAGSMDSAYWKEQSPPDIIRVYRPSMAYRMALIAEGRFDTMFTIYPSWEWDIAAGDLILRKAGAKVTNKRGRLLTFNNKYPKLHGVISANPKLHKALIQQMIY
ncbi:MAG: 3'(2'),5'-bisphosphate nucleotidase CysQ [Aestuariivita sp.]|nr:3'(2'),5'-bisphosphate nucleotidase CysQ [Aestuariivita sp.]